MKQARIFMALFMGAAIFVSGCAKKQEQASLNTDTGFDSLSATDELAQLPQSGNAGANQQASVEALPIEAAPVTQSAAVQVSGAVDTMAQDVSGAAASLEALTHPQKIQTALKNAGLYDGAVDGKLGPKSKRAIEAFQKNHGLKADGKVGPKTWAALEPYLNGSASASTSNGPAVTTENPE